MVLDLYKLKVIDDSLVYTEEIPNCTSYIEDDDGKEYPLLLDLNEEVGDAIKKLVEFYHRTTLISKDF